MVRVRFAPSPTGHLHIGGARTAIFNWLFARHNKGKFILRIEDTDRSRSTEESIQEILEALKWLGLDWDEGPYRQTERMEIYKREAERLIQEGKAYYCYCTPEELEQIREESKKKFGIPKYDGRCRNRKEPRTGVSPVIRFKANTEGETVFHDIIKGEISYPNSQLDDFIIVRSDGTPTYNFVVVVDDALMGITHVIRGDDHLNNTPKQIQLYQALGYEIPQFAHVPMILGPDKTKLSKRHGATSVLAYKEEGYLPEALFNFLVRLGWSHGDQEIFSKEELIELFTLEAVGKSPAVFNPEKLLWLNHHYIKTYPVEKLAELLAEFLEKEGIVDDASKLDRDWLKEVVIAFRERAKTLKEMAHQCDFLFKAPGTYDEKGVKKFFKPETAQYLEALAEELEHSDTFDKETIDKVFENVLTRFNIKLKAVAQPVRIAITGRTVSPGLHEIILLTGKDEVIKRIKRAAAFIRNMYQN
ncbi:glutamyl-tRNA synthetase [Thermosulfidibacter takaii ABI70S6]|uniref:Glutamate--tRNA ligase n=1 Tax=Thermosulfidibacter takaii (strain DSM 17441 / JCM 13301 / NBRC 103674 / ABI70S6) TaxID=1298851 RepID=A0A0S3QUG2_THET7|nr:glutamate--tRNA ligase [Thermosulfidibacter takaii]BAT71962.1 glutamyl-tRNA synthetase [Thermosulfidibacter takaii ABI70S6]